MVLTYGICDQAVKRILIVLEMPELSLGENKKKQVAIIQFRMNKCCGYFGCNFQIKNRPFTTRVTNVIEAGFTEGRNLTVISQIRVDYETEIPGEVNWYQTFYWRVSLSYAVLCIVAKR